MNIEKKFKEVNDKHALLNQILQGVTDHMQKDVLLREIAFNNGQMDILKHFIATEE